MYAYIDESGNTGFNLFDPDQPYFLTVAMSSQVDFDANFRDQIARIASANGQTYLHASEMGVPGVESIAASVMDLVETSGVRFHFACAAKSDVAAMKFFDAIFDPGENPAAPPLSYPVRTSRLFLLLKFAYILETSDVQLFWNAMTSPQSISSEKDAVRAIENIVGRVRELPDARSRELIGDTLDWARNNIGRFSFWTPRKQTRHGHLPNLFSLPALFSGISRDAKEWGCEVEAIIHDQQSQFEQTLSEWHVLFEGLEPEQILHFGDTPIHFGDIQGSRFEIGDTRLSPGLQLVDTVIWTFSRTVNNRIIGSDTAELFDICYTPENALEISFDRVVAELEPKIATLMNRTMSHDQLLQGIRITEYGELLRQQRMRDDAANQISPSTGDNGASANR